MWSALAMAAYIIGLSYLARRESTRSPFDQWPLAFLAIPTGLALLVNAGAFWMSSCLLAGLVTLWLLRSLRQYLWTTAPDIGRAVAALLAGIVLVDLLAVADQPPVTVAIFLLLFVGALSFQRIIPAT